MIADFGKEIEEGLQRDTDETRDERVRPAARLVDEGVYALVRGGTKHGRLAPELPEKSGPVQRAAAKRREQTDGQAGRRSDC